MKKKTPTNHFWAVLVTVNVLAFIYPITLFLRADTPDAQLLATVALVGVGFLLAIVDTICIVLSYLL
jgi:hypothetical protein